MIAIIDYGMGNVRSVLNAVRYLGYDGVITSDPKEIDSASHLILPGVGAFGTAMGNLQKRCLDEILKEQVLRRGKALLGICLGLQLLAKSSEEHGFYYGLGFFDARVVQLNPCDSRLTVPHMGWNDIQPTGDHFLFAKLLRDHFTFYFVHSYHIVCDVAKDVAATCDYGIRFPAVISRNNVVATQFHPEKSQDNGIRVLKNFLEWEI